MPAYELYIVLSIFTFLFRLNGIEFAGCQCRNCIFQLQVLILGVGSHKNIRYFIHNLSSLYIYSEFILANIAMLIVNSPSFFHESLVRESGRSLPTFTTLNKVTC